MTLRSFSQSHFITDDYDLHNLFTLSNNIIRKKTDGFPEKITKKDNSSLSIK